MGNTFDIVIDQKKEKFTDDDYYFQASLVIPFSNKPFTELYSKMLDIYRSTANSSFGSIRNFEFYRFFFHIFVESNLTNSVIHHVEKMFLACLQNPSNEDEYSFEYRKMIGNIKLANLHSQIKCWFLIEDILKLKTQWSRFRIIGILLILFGFGSDESKLRILKYHIIQFFGLSKTEIHNFLRIIIRIHTELIVQMKNPKMIVTSENEKEDDENYTNDKKKNYIEKLMNEFRINEFSYLHSKSYVHLIKSKDTEKEEIEKNFNKKFLDYELKILGTFLESHSSEFIKGVEIRNKLLNNS